jgi:HTH-type transcriptional regulator / antitoxin HigA
METLKYTMIKSVEQYRNYCNSLERLTELDDVDVQNEIDLITLLIEKWDIEHKTFNELDPVQLLKVLMNEHKLKAKDLVEILGLTKGTVSKILSYQKGFSKEVIRALSTYFKVSQEAFNRPYNLLTDNSTPTKNIKRRRSQLSAISA